MRAINFELIRHDISIKMDT